MKRKILSALICLSFVLQACQSALPATPPVNSTGQPVAGETTTVTQEEPASETKFMPILLKAGSGFQSALADLYFTDPASSYAPDEIGGADGIVAASIVSASKSVDVAITSLSLPIITNALIRAKDRGARIRVVLEGDYLAANRPNPQALIDAGISVSGDPEHQEMGNNFIVIDNKQVWTGSMTFTAAGVYHGYNNLVNIHSEELAQNYTKEFEEMFTSGQFGPNVVPDTPNPVVDIQGGQIESMFLPDDLFAARLGELLNNARTSIHFSALSFASQEFGDLIRKKAGDGVSVSGVIDDFELDPANVSQYELFKQAGLDVRLGSPDIILLSNFIIIDKSVVVIGTYDFSKKAELVTDGNVLIIHNEAIAGKYFDDYQIIQSTAQK